MAHLGGPKKLGEIFIERRWLTQKELEEALAVQRVSGKKVGMIAVDRGWINEDQLLEALEERYGVPGVRIDAYSLDPSLIKLITHDLVKSFKVFPLFRVENTLTIAMADPLNIEALDAVRYQTRLEIQETLALEADIDNAIAKYYSMAGKIDNMLTTLGAEEAAEPAEVEDQDDGTDGDDEASIIKFVNLVLSQAARDKASDIHLEVAETEFRIRYRVDGILRLVSTPPKRIANMVVSRIKVLSELDVSERRVPQDGRFKSKIDGRRIDVRVSILPTVHGEKCVMRLLDTTSAIIGLDKLGISPRILTPWKKVIARPEGIVFVTGPTGSGKTTTMYSVLNAVNSVDKNIVTVENPVEYKLPMINQVQVNHKVGMTFASALRAILRQDPDIIMIGEVRDAETADIAIRSAMTGHLVFSTLHTNDSIAAISRLIDMGVEPFLVASSVLGILAQRLVRRICPACKIVDTGAPEKLKSRNISFRKPLPNLYCGEGCRECKNSGYRGRLGIHELFALDETLKSMIMARAPEGELRKHARKNGMVLLREDGLQKALKGHTTIEEILRVT